LSVSIKDVARAAKVSVATVSRALNGHDNVTEAVRMRVVEVAAQLRYSPHHAARSLSSRRTHTIGVVLPDLHGEFFSELMRGIDLVVRENGLHLLVSSYHGHPAEQAAALRTMRGRVDGLLVMAPHVDESDALAQSLGPLPTVLLDTQSTPGGYSSLGIDNYGGAFAMLQHLIEAGHRRIAFIAGPENNFDAVERLRGYREALAQGLPRARPIVVQGDFGEASGHAAGRELLAAKVRPDAVFAANDMMALGCLFAFSQAGVRVPQDIALAGFDDIPLAHLVVPALTTVRVNIADLGGRAARVLLALGNDRDRKPTHTLLTPELIVRESSLRATRRKAG
jgi:LacI family transcriptional regulator